MQTASHQRPRATRALEGAVAAWWPSQMSGGAPCLQARRPALSQRPRRASSAVPHDPVCLDSLQRRAGRHTCSRRPRRSRSPSHCLPWRSRRRRCPPRPSPPRHPLRPPRRPPPPPPPPRLLRAQSPLRRPLRACPPTGASYRPARSASHAPTPPPSPQAAHQRPCGPAGRVRLSVAPRAGAHRYRAVRTRRHRRPSADLGRRASC